MQRTQLVLPILFQQNASGGSLPELVSIWKVEVREAAASDTQALESNLFKISYLLKISKSWKRFSLDSPTELVLPLTSIKEPASFLRLTSRWPIMLRLWLALRSS
jgi:hypothetical protein